VIWLGVEVAVALDGAIVLSSCETTDKFKLALVMIKVQNKFVLTRIVFAIKIMKVVDKI